MKHFFKFSIFMVQFKLLRLEYHSWKKKFSGNDSLNLKIKYWLENDFVPRKVRILRDPFDNDDPAGDHRVDFLRPIARVNKRWKNH